jgi:cellulose synthase/poly-beta-1,6-N-acetylglucosamine synthase-like glycosyltransferase
MKVRDIATGGIAVITRARADWNPELSIVTPYRRNSNGRLLRCLRSALDQTYENFEYVIIDNGSSDDTESMVRDLMKQDGRIAYVRHDHDCGLPAVRANEGGLRAQGSSLSCQGGRMETSHRWTTNERPR